MKGSDYCCIISLISENEAIKLMQNADQTEKKNQTIIKHKNIKTVKYILPSKDVDIEKVLVSKKDFFL